MKTNEEILTNVKLSITQLDDYNEVYKAIELAETEIKRVMELAQNEIRKEYEEKIERAIRILSQHAYGRELCVECDWNLDQLDRDKDGFAFNHAVVIEILDGWKYCDGK